VLTSDGHEGREYAITGPTAVTFSEIAEIMTRVFGRSIAYNDLPEAEFKAALVESGMSEEQAEVGILLHYAPPPRRRGARDPRLREVDRRSSDNNRSVARG
jgi:uncharacterized protein YbjT (DUF2867 family)